MFPKSLSRPDDRLKCAEQWELLSERLFDDLLTVRHASKPPAPSELWQEWSKWDDFTPDSGPNIVGKDTVCDWLRAYEASLATNRSDASSYVQGVVSLLLRDAEAEQVPIVVAQDGRPARVLMLEVSRVEIGSGQQWLHPAFEHRRTDVNAGSGTFAEGMSRTWEAARITGCKPASSDIFWRLRSADGGPLPLMRLDGPSASAAAYRAFWHIAQGLHIDSDVYALADATASDSHIQAVGHLREKISAINAARSSLSPYPPTLIAAKDVSADELAALNTAREWAEVKTVATTAELTAVRSCTASAVIAYMEHLAEKLDETPWTRHGKPVRLSEVHVPPQVWKDEYSFRPPAEREPSGGERDWRPAGYDPASADREVAPRLRQQRRKVRVPWIREFQRTQHQPIVIVGGPGFGKTSLLRWTAREMVLESLAGLHARTKAWSEVHWPIITDLAAWLSKDGDSHDALRDAALDFAPLLKTHPKLQREALPQVVETRLMAQTEHTYLFLDALDLVPATRLRRLRERLGGLDSFGCRLVFSTREAALSSYLPTVPFPRLTILEAAALSTEDARDLAAKWLDTSLATRLEAHLRAHPAMAVVADSPLLLTLACGIVARSPNAELPETGAYLYRDLMQSLARGEWRDSGTDAAYDPDALLARLRPMAWRLFSREAVTNRFSRDTLIRALNGGSSSADAQANAALIQLCHLGFLEGSGHSQGEPHYQFRHTTFLEFLAASHLAAEINAESWAQAKVPQWHSENGWQPIKISEILDASAFEPAWEPLIVFTAGLMKEPRPLIEMLADRKKDDLFRHRLHLLCKCYASQGPDQQARLRGTMTKVFAEITQIARRSTRPLRGSFAGSRLALWWDWLKPLLRCPLAIDALIEDLLVLDGCFSTKAYSTDAARKVVELLKENLTQGRVSAQAVDRIAASLSGDIQSWRHNAALLAWRLAEPEQRRKLEAQFIAKFRSESMADQARVGMAAALALSDDRNRAKEAVDYLIDIVSLQRPRFKDASEYEDRCLVVKTLVSLLDGFFAPIVAPVLITHLLHQDSSSSLWAAIVWQVIGEGERYPANKWLDCLLGLVLSNAPEDGYDFRRWAAEIMAKRTDPRLRDLGLNTLMSIAEKRESGGWAYAARWLVENAEIPFSDRAKELLFTEATNLKSHKRIVAVAELLDMGSISPLGEPIQDAVQQAVLQELHEHHQKYGTRLHISIPGLSDTEVDMILFKENPAAVIKALHTFHGPNIHSRNKRMEDLEENRYWEGRLLIGTRFWSEMLASAVEHLKTSTKTHDRELDIAIFGASSSDLLIILQREFLRTRGKEPGWQLKNLLLELEERGWRLRFQGRRIVVLRRGQEEPRSDAKYGY